MRASKELLAGLIAITACAIWVSHGHAAATRHEFAVAHVPLPGVGDHRADGRASVDVPASDPEPR